MVQHMSDNVHPERHASAVQVGFNGAPGTRDSVVTCLLAGRRRRPEAHSDICKRTPGNLELFMVLYTNTVFDNR